MLTVYMTLYYDQNTKYKIQIDQLQIPLYHYTTIPLYHYTTIPLYHYTTVPLYH